MKILIPFLILVFFCPYALMAQQNISVKGIISDEFGMPLPSATVIERGTVNGVSSDFDGNYSIEVPPGATLEFSFVGYEKQAVLLKENTQLDIALFPDNKLEEVVVVAFGKQAKETIVGSVAVISSKELQSQPATTITQAIQGSIPGINVVNSGGIPGTNPTIRIRGIGSINASAAPLIIVDGAPFNGDLNSIAQEQVASISVLKDASSTSLYGSRGANGVIIISTKSGSKSTETTIAISSSYGNSSMATPMHDLLDINRFTEYFWEASRNRELYENNNSPEVAASLASNNLVSLLGYNPYGIEEPVNSQGELIAIPAWNTDWKKVIINDKAYKKQHGLSVSGGSENTSFYFGSNYHKEQGQIKTTYFERFATRLKLDTQIKDFIKTGLNISYTTSKQNAPNQSGLAYSNAIQWIYSIPNYYPLYQRDSNGALIGENGEGLTLDYGGNNSQSINGVRPAFSGENAYGAIVNNEVLNNNNYVSLNGYIKIDFSKNLNFNSQFSYERATVDNFRFDNNQFGAAASVDGRVSQNRNFFTTINAIQTLNFKHSFGLHTFRADAIFETYEFEENIMGASGTGFLPNVNVLNGSTVPERVAGALNKERMLSAIGRLNYNFDRKYILETSFRRDGSTKFSIDTRWGTFYSVGGSWVVSREDFIRNINWIDSLKLKVSYGELGNNRGIGFFPYLQVFGTGYNQLKKPGVLSLEFVDPNLSWEKTALTNAGAEFSLFGNRLNGSIEYYTKESIDLIYDKPLALSTGNESVKTNVGAVKNSGLEFTFNSKVLEWNDFNLNLGLNFSFDKNEITELTQDEFIDGNKKWKVGKSLYEFYLQKSAGVDFIDGYQMWYKDIVTDQGIKTGERITTKDYTEATRYYTGKSSIPLMVGGFAINASYGNFDLSTLFNFSFGSYVYDGVYASLMNGFVTPGRQGHPDLSNRWQKPGDLTDVPLFMNGQNDFNAESTRFLFKNNYVRLRALNIGYNFNQSLIEKFKIKQLRVFLQGDNIFTFQSHKGIDPEQDLSGLTDNRSHQMKTYALGVNLQL